jgi:hypothetical protein
MKMTKDTKIMPRRVCTITRLLYPILDRTSVNIIMAKNIIKQSIIIMECDFSYWTSSVKNLMRTMEFLKNENKQLHLEVIDLK